MSLSIGIAFAIVIVTTLATSRLAARGRRVSLSEWAVGGGSFGAVLVWFLSAGEIYTTFAFLGGSGLAYAEGAPAFYILANAPLAYVLGFWIQPRIWALSRMHHVYTRATTSICDLVTGGWPASWRSLRSSAWSAIPNCN